MNFNTFALCTVTFPKGMPKEHILSYIKIYSYTSSAREEITKKYMQKRNDEASILRLKIMPKAPASKNQIKTDQTKMEERSNRKSKKKPQRKNQEKKIKLKSATQKQQ